MTLGEYLDGASITRRAFAARLGVHPVTVTKWVTGSQRPSWPLMARIRAATEGRVTAADFEAADDAPEAA